MKYTNLTTLETHQSENKPSCDIPSLYIILIKCTNNINISNNKNKAGEMAQ